MKHNFTLRRANTGWRPPILAVLSLVLVLFAPHSQAQTANTLNAAGNIVKQTDAKYNKLAFIPNGGQWPAHVLYKADLPNGQAVITREGVITGIFDPSSLAAISKYTMALEENSVNSHNISDGLSKAGNSNNEHTMLTKPRLKGHGWMLNFANANPVQQQHIERTGESDDTYNYLLSGDGRKDATGLHSYAEITYRNVYDHVDVRYYGTPDNRGLEYDVIVAPGGDVNKVRFAVDGIDAYSIDAKGQLVLGTSIGKVAIGAPVCYTQDAAGKRTPVTATYKKIGHKLLGFSLSAYDRSQTLIIDPIVMRWATWVSNGSGIATNETHNHAVDLDAAGNIYTAGYTFTDGLIVTAGAIDATFNSANDMWFGKYTEPAATGGTGSRIWQTYLGGTGADQINTLQVGSDGNIYASGYTWSDMPVRSGTGFTAPTYTNRAGADRCLAVVKINPSGTGALVRTIGVADGIATECVSYGLSLQPASGGGFNVVVSGRLYLNIGNILNGASGEFPRPVTPAGVNVTMGEGTAASGTVVASFSSNFNTVNWTRLYAANTATSSYNAWWGMAMDGSGNLYLSGNTDAASGVNLNNTTTQTTRTGTFDGLLLKLNANGIPQISRYFNGTTGNTNIRNLNVASDNSSIIIGGVTQGLATANLQNALFNTHAGGTNDFFVARMPLSLLSTTWGTYIGGNGNEINMMGVNTDANNDVYFLGYTNSTDFPTAQNPVQKSLNLTGSGTNRDATFTKLRADGGAILYSTLLGGSGDDYDPLGNNGIKFYDCRIYLAITSGSNTFPLTSGAITTGAITGTSQPVLVSFSSPLDLGSTTLTPVTQSICSGAPAASITSTTPSFVVPTMSRNGANVTSPSTQAYPDGVPVVTSYQWQKSTNGFTWTNIAGATALTLTSAQIGTLTENTTYRLSVGDDFCRRANDPAATITINGSAADFGDLSTSIWPVASAVIPTCTFTNNAPDLYNGTTVTSISVYAGARISSETATISNGDNAASTDAFDDGLSSSSIAIVPLVTYPLTVQLNANRANTRTYFRMWIDWNANGNFTDDIDAVNGEGGNATYSGSAMVTSAGAAVPYNFNITVPTGAQKAYKIRLVVSNTAIPDVYRANGATYVLSLPNGEVEDYSTPIALPVSIIQFDAYKNQQTNASDLIWKVGDERNVLSYNIFHGINGVNYTKIGSVRANNSNTYSYTHHQPTPNANYYQLQIEDQNASVGYSQVRVVNFAHSSTDGTIVFPNPAKNHINIQLPHSLVNSAVELELYNSIGQLVAAKNLPSATPVAFLDISSLSNAIYILKIRTANGLQYFDKVNVVR